MKTQTIIISISLLMTLACGKTGDKEQQLAELKKERDLLNTKIASLEKELRSGKNDATNDYSQVKVIQAVKDTFTVYIEVRGSVDGDENVTATAQTPGLVKTVNVREGQTVQKGQVLAELDATVLKQSLTEMENSYVFATDLYNRQKALWEQKIGSEVQYLSAKNNKESLEKRIATLKEQIALSKIVSPIQGRVEEVNLRVGQSAVPGIPMFRVINFSKIKIMADISDVYSSVLNTGTEVRLLFPETGTETKGSVTFISRYINPVNRTFKAEINPVATTSLTLRANMLAIVRIPEYQAVDVFSVPSQLIFKENDISWVYIAEKNGEQYSAKKRQVKTGKTYKGMTEVTEGLEEGEILIVLSNENLQEGSIVRF